MEITFLTGNKNKLREAKEILTYHNIQKEEIDLEEIQAVDSRDLIVAKLVLGYEKVKKPIMVEDTGLHFECLNGLPGALIKWFIKKIGVEGCWDLVKRYDNHNAEVRCVVGYTEDGKDLKIFEGIVKGKIVEPGKDNGFDFDRIFIQNGYNKRYSEMTLMEKNRISHRRIAMYHLKEYLEDKING